MSQEQDSPPIIVPSDFFELEVKDAVTPQDIEVGRKEIASYNLPREFFSYFQIEKIKN
jgi:hypothetical protein